MADPMRGEVWRVDFEPVRGHEQGGARPALILSSDIFNSSAAGLVVVSPITTKGRPIRSFLRLDPPEGGVKLLSFVICDQVRTISTNRLQRRLGVVSRTIMQEVEERIRILLDLP